MITDWILSQMIRYPTKVMAMGVALQIIGIVLIVLVAPYIGLGIAVVGYLVHVTTAVANHDQQEIRLCMFWLAGICLITLTTIVAK